MARRTLIGGDSSNNTQQVSTATPANVEIGDTFTISIQDETNTTETTVAFVATATTVANVTAGLAAAWAASTHPLATAIAASDSTTHLTLTANVAGTPFYITTAATDGGGTDDQTLTAATTTTSRGPQDVNNAYNWLEGEVAVADDEVYFANTTPMIYGMYQQDKEYDYFEVLPSSISPIGRQGFPLMMDVAQGTGQFIFAGRGRAYIDVNGYDVRELIVNDTAPQPSPLEAGLNLYNFGNDCGLIINQGTVSLDPDVADTIAQVDLRTSAAGLLSAINITITKLNQFAGFARTVGEITNVIQFGGEGRHATLPGSQLLLYGGVYYAETIKDDSIGTFTLNGGSFNFTRTQAALTITNATFNEGGEMRGDFSKITWTNKPTTNKNMILSTQAL